MNSKAELHILGSNITAFLAKEFVPVVCKGANPSLPLIQIKGKGKSLAFGHNGMVKLSDTEGVEFAFHVFAKDMKKLEHKFPVSLISQKESDGVPEVKKTVSLKGVYFEVNKDGRVTVTVERE